MELSEQLSRGGYSCDCVNSLDHAREIVRLQEYGVALVDRRLPDGDGLSLVAAMRRTQPKMCILVLTAIDETNEIVASLDAGADDYVTKPFEPDELMARIRASLRRAAGAMQPLMKLARLCFDPATRDFAIGQSIVVLQRREAILLETLMRRAGRVVLREALFDEIWGEKEDLTAHNLNGLVSQLRLRLKELNAGVDIHVARGLGYFLAEEKA